MSKRDIGKKEKDIIRWWKSSWKKDNEKSEIVSNKMFLSDIQDVPKRHKHFRISSIIKIINVKWYIEAH